MEATNPQIDASIEATRKGLETHPELRAEKIGYDDLEVVGGEVPVGTHHGILATIAKLDVADAHWGLGIVVATAGGAPAPPFA